MFVAADLPLIVALRLVVRLLVTLSEIALVPLDDHHWGDEMCRRPKQTDGVH